MQMPEIKTIEDLSLNAWPSHQIEIYDGWLLRFSYFYTHRTNSVEQIGISSIPLPEKIDYCENRYKTWGTPSVFKISPLSVPELEPDLEERGYEVEHITRVMFFEFPRIYQPDPPAVEVNISPLISDQWIQGLFTLKNTTNVMHRKIVPSMYRAIPKETICVNIREGERIIGTGLGILDRDYVGVYAIHVHPDYRRRGYARSICTTILREGRRKGAAYAYLQVVDDNASAIALYESLGFRQLYTYWFRTLQLIG